MVQLIGEIARRGLGKRVFGVRTTSWEYLGDVPGSPVSVSTPLRLEGLGSGGLALQMSWTSRPWSGAENNTGRSLGRERPVSPLVVGQSLPGVNGSDLKIGRGSKSRLLVPESLFSIGVVVARM